MNTKPSPQVFINPVYLSRLTDEYLFNVAKYGKLAVLKREIPNKKLESLAMQPFGQVLSDKEIWSVIRYIRETFINPNRKKTVLSKKRIKNLSYAAPFLFFLQPTLASGLPGLLFVR